MNNQKAILAYFDDDMLQALSEGGELEIDTNGQNQMTMTLPTANLHLAIDRNAPDSAIYTSVDSQHLTYVASAVQANVTSVNYTEPGNIRRASNIISSGATSAAHFAVPGEKAFRTLDKGKGKAVIGAYASRSTAPEPVPVLNTRTFNLAAQKFLRRASTLVASAKKPSPPPSTPPSSSDFCNKESSVTSLGFKKSTHSPKLIKKAASHAARRSISATPTEVKYSLRTRVIQRLAFRPFTISSLARYLNVNLTQPADYFALTEIVKNCGIPIDSLEQTRYCLKPQLYAELIVDDWPLYNEEEKKTVKSNIAEATTLLKKTRRKVSKRTHDDSDDELGSSHKKQRISSVAAVKPAPPSPSQFKIPSARIVTSTTGPTTRKVTPMMPERRTTVATPVTASSTSTKASTTTVNRRQLLYQRRRPVLIKSQENFNAYCVRHEDLRVKYGELMSLLDTKYAEFADILVNETHPTKARLYHHCNEQYKSQLMTAYSKTGLDFGKVEALAADIFYVRSRLEFLYKSIEVSVEKYGYKIPQ